MSTFLNRFLWNDDGRLVVNSSFSGTPVFHDGLAYDEDQALVVDYGGTARFFLAGIGLTDAGALLVLDSSSGLPSDVVWQSGLPISGGESRLCVDTTNEVSYNHQGVNFTGMGAVAVTGGVVTASFYEQEASIDDYEQELSTDKYIRE